MQTDHLQRLIEAADFASLRDLARHVLWHRGLAPAHTDGPYDGGQDIALYFDRTHPERRLGVQVSVERKWRPKLHDDAHKAHAKLGLRELMFVSSRRVPEVEFQRESDVLQRTLGVVVTRMDSQYLAAYIKAHSELLTDLSRILGLPIVAPAASFSPPDFRRDLGYAFAFFGGAPDDLRTSVIEQAVRGVVARAGGSLDRAVVVDGVAVALDLSTPQRALIDSTIDRLLQRGALAKSNGHLVLEAAAVVAWTTARASQGRDRAQLEAAIDHVFATRIPDVTRRRQAIDALMDDLGALPIDAGSSLSRAMFGVDGGTRVGARVRHLHGVLDSLGVSTSGRSGLIEELVRAVDASAFGKALVVGELFCSLVSLGTPQLLRALGGGGEVEVVLDASVAMPMLLGLLYEPTHQVYFRAASALHRLAQAHQIPLMLPEDYLEEVASHLIDAQRRYGRLAERDSSLVASENAAVAHFAALRAAGYDRSFAEYLEGLGLREALRDADYFVARDSVKSDLRKRARQYGLEVRRLTSSPAARRRAEEALTYLLDESARLRPPLLVRHDAGVLGYLFDTPSGATKTHVVATWDRQILQLRERESAPWEAMDPLVLTEALSLARGTEDELSLTAASDLALELSDQALHAGAAILDQLARYEQSKMYDAELAGAAQRFKDEWLAEPHRSTRSGEVQRAWETWKAQHPLGSSRADEADHGQGRPRPGSGSSS